MVRHRKPPSPAWRAFLQNHVGDIVAADSFVVPTVRNRILFVFLIMAHSRRHALHFNVTAHPTAEWTAQQIVEAFPWDEAPRFLLRDRDGIDGEHFSHRVTGMGIEQVVIGARSPWQKGYASHCTSFVRFGTISG